MVFQKILTIPFKQAHKYIEKYFEQYPGIQSNWMGAGNSRNKKSMVMLLRTWGRRRYVPGIYESNRVLYDLAKRIAINTKAQGTAAEIMKQAYATKLEQAFAKNNLKAKMILQIHDELLISVPESQRIETRKRLLKTFLENVVTWNVPLKVTTRFGYSWQEVTK